MKNLLSLMDLNKKDINNIFEVATQMRRIVQNNYKKGPQLIGSMVAGVWETPSISSTAFNLGVNYLSGSFSSVFASDDMLEQCQMFDSMGVNAVVISCQNDHLADVFATQSRCSVINGGSDQYDPIGVLADLMAINSRVDSLQGLTVVAVGNKDTNRINELTYCLQQYGSTLVWYLPKTDDVTVRKGIVVENAEAAFSGADAIIDLGLTPFSDSSDYYGAIGGIPESLIDKARINCPLLGCRTIVDRIGVRNYHNSIASLRDCCYVSIVMAVLYLIHRN